MRPPRVLDRLTETPGGQRLSPRRRPWRDGSTALRLDPVERLARVATLVPAPRRPWLAYHGVLAPHAAWRAALVRAPAPGDVRRGVLGLAAQPAPRLPVSAHA